MRRAMRETLKPIPSTAKPVALAETGGTAAKRPTYVLLLRKLPMDRTA